MKRDFTYCTGKYCSQALREHCIRYIEGQKVPKDAEGFWWMDGCGDNREGYINK